MTNRARAVVGLTLALCLHVSAAEDPRQPVQEKLPYSIVDTEQDRCFSDVQEVPYPAARQPFFGQDAQYQGLTPAYKDNGDGTITDLNTGLMWVKSPGTSKRTYRQAAAGAKACRVGGHDDWRLPAIKELYSLIDFRGYSMRTAQESVPYLDTTYFDFVHGSVAAGERAIDAQYWSSTVYVGTTMMGAATTFGVNFADGRIKGYGQRHASGRSMKQFVRYVRRNPEYGLNHFIDNGDGTITDRATDLMWMKNDSGKPMKWRQALAWAENLQLAGHADWRLPNAKELQSIVDYSRAPMAAKRSRRGAAIDPIFHITRAESWFWTSTTHLEHRSCAQAVYICFGRAFGYMGPSGRKRKMDVHGAGAQRSDPKNGDPDDYAGGRGPQGDVVRILNYVRCVRGGAVTRKAAGPAIDGTFTAGRSSADADRGLPPQGRRSGPDTRPGFVRRLDEDGDGKVSRREFDGPPDQFDVLDRNRDGSLSDNEAPRRPPPGARPPRR